jgi:hypothetical protein
MSNPIYARFARAVADAGGRDSFHVSLSVDSAPAVRIPIAVLPARPQTRGDREYLRALRAAEMKSWQASGGDALTLSNTP